MSVSISNEEDLMEKSCYRCQEVLDISFFNRDKSAKDGYKSTCKICRKNNTPKRKGNFCIRGHAFTPENTYIPPSGGKQCKMCHKTHVKTRTPMSYRVSNLLHRFGLTIEMFDEMLSAQGNKCGNPKCDETKPGGNYQWHVDHDRKCCPGTRSCGKCVRGLLCHGCNTGTGLADSIPKLIGKIEYLIKYQDKMENK